MIRASLLAADASGILKSILCHPTRSEILLSLLWQMSMRFTLSDRHEACTPGVFCCQSLFMEVLLATLVRRKQDEQVEQLEASITPVRTGGGEGSPRKNLVSPKPQLSVVHINMDID